MSGKPIDYHFRMLGLQRGCSEEDLKKAYRKKALEYHPDRNPQGADAFKQINTAYEELGKHFKVNGGKDGRVGTTGASAGSAYQYARTSSTTFDNMFSTEPSSSLPRDNAMWSQFYRAAAAAAANSRENTSARKDEDGAKTGPSSDARWRQAHGSRVPVSGYSSGGSGNTHNPPPRTTADYMDKKFTVPLFTSTPKSYAELKFMFDQLYTKTEYVREGLPVATDEERESFEKMKDSKLQTMWSNLQKLRNDEEKRKSLRREWERTEEDLRERAETMKMEQDILKSQRTKEEQRRADLQAERMRINRAHEAARKQREERERKEKESQAKAATSAAAAEKFRETQEDQRDRMLDDKRRLLKKMLNVQYSPDSGEVGNMSDVEVFTLLNILRENVDRVEAVFQGRMAGGPCSRCKNAPKVSNTFAFQCTHACVCHNCGQVANRCPLCGAMALTPPSSSVDGSRRAPKTTPMKASSPVRQRNTEKKDPLSPRISSHRDASEKLSGSSGSPLEASEVRPPVSPRVQSSRGSGRKPSHPTTASPSPSRAKPASSDHPPLFSQYYPQPKESAFPSSPRHSESPSMEPRRSSTRRNSVGSPSRSRPHSRSNANESFSSAPTVGPSFSATAVNGGGRESSPELRSPRMTSAESHPATPFIEKVEMQRDSMSAPRERTPSTTQVPLSHAHKPVTASFNTSATSGLSSPHPTPRVVSTPPPGPAPAQPRPRSLSSSEERPASSPSNAANPDRASSPRSTAGLRKNSSSVVTLLVEEDDATIAPASKPVSSSTSKRAPSTSGPGGRAGKAVPTPPQPSSLSPPPRHAGSPRPPRYAPASFLKEAEEDAGTSLSASMLSSGEVTSVSVKASQPKPASTKEAAPAATNLPRTTVNKTATSPPPPAPSAKNTHPKPVVVKKASIPAPIPPPRDLRSGSMSKKNTNNNSYSSDSLEHRAAPPPSVKSTVVQPITSREEAPAQNARKRPEDMNRHGGESAGQHRFLGVCSVPLLQFFRQDQRVSITRGATFLFDNAAVTSDIQLAGGSSRDSNPGLWENLVMQCGSMAEADVLVEALVQGHAEEILNPPIMPDNVSEVLRSRSASRRRGRPQSSEEEISPVSRDALPPPPRRTPPPVEEERRSPKPRPRRSPSTVSTRSTSHHRRRPKMIPEEDVEDMFRRFMKFEHHRQHLLLYMHKELVHQAYNAAEAGVLAAEASKTYSAAEKERLQQIEDKLNETEELYKEVKAQKERLDKAKKALDEDRRRMADGKARDAAPAAAPRNVPPPQDYDESFLGHLPSNANVAERQLRRVIPGRSWKSCFFPECEEEVRHGAVIDIATATKLPRSLITLQQVKPISRSEVEEPRKSGSKRHHKKKSSHRNGYADSSSSDDEEVEPEEGLLVVAKVKFNEDTHDGDTVERRLNRCGFALLEQMYAHRDAFQALKEEKRAKDPKAIKEKHAADRRDAIRHGKHLDGSSRSTSVTSSSNRGSSSHGHRHRRPNDDAVSSGRSHPNRYDNQPGYSGGRPRQGYGQQPPTAIADGPYRQGGGGAPSSAPYAAPRDPYRSPQQQNGPAGGQQRPPYQTYPNTTYPSAYAYGGQPPASAQHNGHGYGGSNPYSVGPATAGSRSPGTTALAPYENANRPLTSSSSSAPTLGLLQSNEAVDRAVVEVAEARQRRIIMTAHRHRLSLLELQQRERAERRRLEQEQEPLERLVIQSQAQPLKYFPEAQQAVLKAEALHRDKIYRSEDQARQKLQFQGGQLMAKGVSRAREALFKDEYAERVLIESEALSKTLDIIAYDQRHRDREAANRVNRSREQARRKEQMFDQMFESLFESEREERQTIVRSEARLRPVLRQEMIDEEEVIREKKKLKEEEALQQQKEEQSRLMDREQQYRREVEEDEERARQRLRLSQQEEHQRQKQLEEERTILTPNYRDPSTSNGNGNHKPADVTSRESTYTEGDSSYSRRRRLDSQRRVKPFHYMTFSPEDMDFKPNAESAIEGILGCTINRNLEVVEISRRLPKAADEEGEFQAGDMILDASGQSLHSISHLREVLSHRIMLIQEEARMEFPDIPEEELTTNPALQKYIEVLCEHHNFLMQVLRGCDIYQLIVKS